RRTTGSSDQHVRREIDSGRLVLERVREERRRIVLAGLGRHPRFLGLDHRIGVVLDRRVNRGWIGIRDGGLGLLGARLLGAGVLGAWRSGRPARLLSCVIRRTGRGRSGVPNGTDATGCSADCTAVAAVSSVSLFVSEPVPSCRTTRRKAFRAGGGSLAAGGWSRSHAGRAWPGSSRLI
ncbi:hypothetical protein, partial [Rhodococcus sp. (in: high G+C Gram-positive bacteria)]|uniref:hypothetical protein n=1 Tax=Rhodococcus sp. TaxID=1831 RepID=UPI00388FD94B